MQSTVRLPGVGVPAEGPGVREATGCARGQCFLNTNVHRNRLGSCYNVGFGSADLGQGLRVGLCNKLPGRVWTTV